jgi:hypothetical protein
MKISPAAQAAKSAESRAFSALKHYACPFKALNGQIN